MNINISNTYNLMSYEKFDEALKVINSLDECNITETINEFKTLKTLPKDYSDISNNIENVLNEINKSAKGSGPATLIENYKAGYNDIKNAIIAGYIAEYEFAFNNAAITLGAGELKKFKEELNSLFANMNKKNNDLNPNSQYKSLGEFFKEIEDICIKYSIVAKENANSLFIGSNLLPKNNSDIAHRGYGPGENTATAFRLAGEKGFWGCEADIRFDSNGNLVCSHDKVGKNENPTTFEEYLDICKEYGMTAIIDIKYENGVNKADAKLSPAILEVIKSKGMMDSCILQTNNSIDLSYIRENSNDARIWYLTNNLSNNNVQLIKDNSVECVNLKAGDYTAEQIKKLNNLGVNSCVWDVRTKDSKDRLLNKGATYIVTDNVLGITPYEEGQEDFNNISNNYVTKLPNFSNDDFAFISNLSNLSQTTADVINLPVGNYTGEILVAPKGRIEYDRADGVHVQESWCQLQYLDTVLGNLRKFEGDKVVEGQYIKDLEVWTRDDGVKMLGPYVMVATDVIGRRKYGIDDDLSVSFDGMYDYGDIVETTLGKGIVMDICSQAKAYRRVNGDNYTNLEVYTDWMEPEYRSMVYAKDYVPKNYAHNPLHVTTNQVTNVAVKLDSSSTPSTETTTKPSTETTTKLSIETTTKPSIETTTKPSTETTTKPSTETTTKPSTPSVKPSGPSQQLSNILPNNKFSDMLPSITKGTLGAMEISKSGVSYNLLNVNKEVYDNYVELLQKQDYVMNENGVYTNGKYEVLTSYDNDGTMNISLKVKL